MSVIVRGMDMPIGCASCFVDRAYCRLWKKVPCGKWRDERHSDCPLIELPPHGRLIDIKSVEYGKFTTAGNEYQRWWNGALESVIDNAPTVIEGSET